MEHYDSDYFADTKNLFSRVVANVVKYASLLGGIYSVCKDEKDVGAAIVLGGCYLFADGIRESLKERADAGRMATLEKRLKE